MNDDDLTIEIDDETLEALTRKAQQLGISVEEFARHALVQSFRREPVQSTSDEVTS